MFAKNVRMIARKQPERHKKARGLIKDAHVLFFISLEFEIRKLKPGDIFLHGPRA